MTTTSPLITQWLDWLTASGLAPSTRNLRRVHLEKFARRVELEQAAETDVIAALAAMAHQRPESRRSFLASLRNFYRWAAARDLVPADPTAKLPPIRVPQGLPRPIPESALRAAFATADRETRLALALGAYAGLRISEIAAVHARDVTPFGLIVTGKGGKQRRIPIHPALAPYLADLTGWAFPNPRSSTGHMGTWYVRARFERVLPPPYTPHSLRHRFATAAYRGTHDLRAVQTLLGHTKPETTARYTLMNDDALIAAVAAIAA